MLNCDTPIRTAKVPGYFLLCFYVVFSFFALGARAHAQGAVADQKIGASATQTISVAASASGHVGSVEVLTLGAAGLDYSDAGGTCSGASLSAGQTCTVNVKFTPQVPGLRRGAVLLLDSTGLPMGSSYLRGAGVGGLAVFSSPNEVTVAGSGGWTQVGDGSPALSAQLNLPASVVTDGAGNLYIADSLHNRIRMVSSGNGSTLHNSVSYPQQGYITTIAGNGIAGWTGDGMPASDSSVSLTRPSGLAIDGAGNLFIADTGNHVIRKIDAATGVITTVVGNGVSGRPVSNVAALQASLDTPWGITVDSSGSLFIADTNNQQIRTVCGAGVTEVYGVSCGAPGNIVTVAGSGRTTGTGVGAFGGDKGPAIKADLNAPYAVAFDAQGNMFIPDSGNNRVRKVDPAGVITTVAGNGNAGYYGDGWLASAAQLQAPVGLAIDPAQNIYISDGGNSAIRKVNAKSKKIYSVLRGGVGEYLTGQKVLPTSLYGPKGIALDGSGNLYIADYYNMRVRVLPANAAFLDYLADPILQGNTSAPKTQTIENDGNDDLTISSVSPDANSAFDDATTTCLTASPVAIDAQCDIGVEFAPTTDGNPLFAEVSIAGTSQNAPLVITLAGDAMPINSTSVALVSQQNPAVFGQPVSITATVTTGQGTGQPKGTLDFYDGTNLLQGGVSINSLGSGSILAGSLTVGSHTITAKYSGDPNHLASTSYPMAQLVTESTTVTLTPSANPAKLGSSLTLTATVSAPAGGGVLPDGLVAILDGSATLATVKVDANGLAVFKTSGLAQGPHTLTAEYGGDNARYVSASTSAQISLSVVAPSTLAVSATPNPSNYGTPVTFKTTLQSGSSIAATGTVTLFDGNQTIGSQSLSGSVGTIDFTIPDLGVGTHSITASYGGDQNVASSTSVSLNEVIATAKTTTTLAVDPAQPVAGTAVTLVATVSPSTGKAAATGSVTFFDGAADLGTAPIQTGNAATLTASLSAGTHTLSASYSGDANNAGSKSVSEPVNVKTSAAQVALTSSATTAQVLSPIAFTAVASSTGAAPTGTIKFMVDGAVAGSAAVDAKGAATFSDGALAVGTHSVMASYEGDANTAAATSAIVQQVITAIPTSTMLSASSTRGSTPQSVLVASVLGTSGQVPTGTISFMNGSTLLSNVALGPGGVATFAPSLPPGSSSIVARYGGDAVHAASTSAPVSVTGHGGGFAVKVDPPTLNVSTGSEGELTITLSSLQTTDDTVQMGCLGLPAEVSCHFSTEAISLKGGEKKKIQVVIATQLFAGSGRPYERPGTGRNGAIALAALSLPGGLLCLLLWRWRLRNKAFLGLCLVLSISAAMALTGCGGSIGFSKAAPGTYHIQIGGTGAATHASIFENVTLTVK